MNAPRPWYAETVDPIPRPESVDISRRLAFLQLGEDERLLLRALAEKLADSASQFADTFYRHLFAFPETARFLSDPQLVTRLKQTQQAHLQSMLEANWNEEYVERRHRVGDVHAQVGINPHIFLGAYNQYLQFCVRRLAADLDSSGLDCAEQVVALQKAVFLDIGLTLEAYFTQATHSLRHALDLIYQANVELRQFAQLTSHDLKTPLATVANLCDEALDEFREKMPAEAARLIEGARSRAFRMSATIDELLSSALNFHDQPASAGFCSQQLIAEAVEQVRPMLDKKRIELHVADDLPAVVGDRARTREVFYNLLSNAVKFLDKPRGRISISCRRLEREAVFSVADNGPGIPAEELARVFVPFRRLPAHRDVPGSGLGLYFAKTIVEQQLGRIWVESELGRGCTFFVALPLAPAAGEARPSRASTRRQDDQ